MKKYPYLFRINELDITRDYIRETINEELESKTNNLISDIDYLRMNKNDHKIELIIENIKKSSSLEEVTSLRKDLNREVNKIKRELIKKETDEEDLNNYMYNVNALRGEISELVRFIKRDSNLQEVIKMNDKEFLTFEEKEELDKMVKKEFNFNERLLNKYNPEHLVKNDKVVVKEPEYVGKHVKKEYEPKHAKKETTITNVNNLYLGRHANYRYKLKPYKNIVDGVKHNIERYSHSIKINRVYTSNIIKNVGKFVLNVPNYIRNRSTLHKMMYEFSTYYRGEDLYETIALVEQDNSVKFALKEVFNRDTNEKRELLNTYRDLLLEAKEKEENKPNQYRYIRK